MNIDEFIYDRGLSGSLYEEDRNYIENCISDISRAGSELYEKALEFCDAAKAFGENFEKKVQDYFFLAKGIALVVKKYNDSFPAGGIWSSVSSADEKKKNLKRYYQHLARLDSLNGSLLLTDFWVSKASELKIRLANFEKTLLLYKLSLDFCGATYDCFYDTKIVFEKAADKLERHIESLLAMFRIRENNDRIFGEYLASLCTALDVRNKGERMNVRLARNSNISFVSAFRTEL